MGDIIEGVFNILKSGGIVLVNQIKKIVHQVFPPKKDHGHHH